MNNKKVTITFPADVWAALLRYCTDYEIDSAEAVKRLVEDQLDKERYLR